MLVSVVQQSSSVIHIHTYTHSFYILFQYIGHYRVSATSKIWPPDKKRWLTGKNPDAGKDWGQEENGATEGEMVGWHHWLNRHEFVQAPRNSEGQGSLVCCGPWGCKESDMTEWLKNNRALSRVSCAICSCAVLFLVAHSCLTLCDPTDCSSPGSSVSEDSPGHNTGVGCHALLQRIFPTQGLNPGLPHCRQILYHLNHQRSPCYTVGPYLFFIHFPLKSFS